MKKVYFIPRLRVIDLSSEGVVAASGDDAGGSGTGDNSDADGRGPIMPWGSSKRKDIWGREENSSIWK